MIRPVGAIVMALLFVIAASLIFLPDYESPHMVKFLIISQVMFALSIMLFLFARRLDFDKEKRRLFFILIAIALIARGVMFVGAGDKAYISDDVYRYIWDGKIIANGINPYRYAPDDEEVADLIDSTIHPYINHNYLPTIYPPMAQNIFLVAYVISGEHIWGFKLLAALFELLTIFALYVWLKILNISKANLLLWLFSPLILIEFYLSSHLDILGLPFLIGSLITLQQRRPLMTGLLLAMATLVKFYGLFLLPFFFFHFIGKNKLKFILAFIGSVVALYLPYAITAGVDVFGSLLEYLSDWQFNGSLFLLLKQVISLDYARIVVAVLFLGWIIWALTSSWSLFDKMFATIGGYLILTPTFFPWYFVWIYPFMLRNLSLAFLFLSGSVILSYHVLIGKYENGGWVTIDWLVLAVYVPFYVTLIIETLIKKRSQIADA